jgi:hypothetical protein
MTLSGESSVANYQTALRSVTYNDTSPTPNATARTVTWQVNDGAIANAVSNTPTSSINITKQSQTITFTSTAPTHATPGGPGYVVTAMASSGLPVTLSIDAVASSVCSISGSASGSTVTFQANGTCVIDANQPGDASFNPAPQVQQSFAVKTDQTISFTSTAPTNATVGGPTYTVTATATSGLAVTFAIDVSAGSVCSIAGSTVSFGPNAGMCVINANQAGNANFWPAPQVQQSFPVKSNQTITFTSSAPTHATPAGPGYVVTATASSGLPVTLAIDATASSVCSISGSASGSTVSFLANGTCVIDANQPGDATFNPAPQVQQSFAVKTDQTISFTSSPPAQPAVGGPTYGVTATATSGLTVTFTIDATASTVCSISGSTVSFIGNGTCVIDANQAGNANFWPAPQVQQSFTVKTNQAITFTSTAPTNAVYQGPTYTATATGGGSGNPVTFSIDASATSVCSSSGANGSTISFIGTGTCQVNADQAGNTNFYAAPTVSQSFSVGPNLQADSYNVIGNTELVAAGHSSPTTPFTAAANTVLANDSAEVAITATAVTNAATTGGGSITLDANGKFTYTPPLGQNSGTDTYTYTGTAHSVSRTATITFNISNAVWYVDPNAGSNGNGQSQSPWNTTGNIKQQPTVGGAHTGDTIFVYSGTTSNLTGAITLLASQSLIGQGVALVVNSTTLVNAGTFPVLGGTLTLANSVTVNGIDMSTTTNSAIVGASTTGLNVTVRNLTTSTGTALNLSGATHPTGTVGITKLMTSGSGSGAVHVSLTNTDANVTITDTTSSLAGAGASTKAIDINGGTGNFSYPGTISNTGSTGTNGGGISIANKTGSGTVTLNGQTITLNTGSSTAFNMSGNSAGTTVNVTPASGGSGLDITTTSGAGFNATGGGTVVVTGSGNTISSTTGTALNVSSTTIGASGLNFLSISANGATNGILLNATGTTGGLTVTGNSSGNCGGTVTINPVGTAATFTAPDTNDCTGGTIQSTTGAGISLTTVGTISLTRMRVMNSGTDGINLTGGTGFTLDHSFVTDTTGLITHNGVKLGNVSGTVTISNGTFVGGPENNIFVDNLNTNMTSLSLTSSVLRDNVGIPTNGIANDGLLVQMRGTSVLTSALVNNSVFTNLKATGVQFVSDDTGRIGNSPGDGSVTAPTASNSVTIQNSTFTNNNIAIDVSQGQRGNVAFELLNNTLSVHKSHSLNAATAAGTDTGPGSHFHVGKIDGNSLGTQGTKDSGSLVGNGIRGFIQGDNTKGSVTVSNNSIHEVANADILTFTGQNGNGTSSTLFTGTAKFKVVSNAMPTPSGSTQSFCGPPNTACALNGIFVLADEDMAVCNVITGNSVYDVTTMNGANDIELAERTGPPAGAQLTVEGTGGSNSTYIQANNTLTGPAKFLDEGGNTSQVALGACGSFP